MLVSTTLVSSISSSSLLITNMNFRFYLSFIFIGKTTFVNVIASGSFNEDMIPTVGFNMRKITKGNVTIKLWDIGGQPR